MAVLLLVILLALISITALILGRAEMKLREQRRNRRT